MPQNQTQQVLRASETTVTKINIWQECDGVVSAYWVIYSIVNLLYFGHWNCEAVHLSKYKNHRNNFIWFWKAMRDGQGQLSFQETLLSAPVWFCIFFWSSLLFSAEKILLLALILWSIKQFPLYLLEYKQFTKWFCERSIKGTILPLLN